MMSATKLTSKLIVVLFILVGSINLAFSEVKASLQQSTVFAGDPVILLIETSQNTNAKPDLSPLQKDFQVLGTSTSSQHRVFNGQRSYKKTWTVSLQAKHKGELNIPSIRVGNEKTEALKVTLKDVPPEVKAETSQHVFVESSVNTKGDKTYVQQQIPYIVKLFYDSSMQSAEIQTPDINNAVIEKLGDDRRYQIERDGKLFTVVEKHFVISPEKSGTLHIPPTIVKGRMSQPNPNEEPRRRGNSRGNNNQDFLNRFFRDFRKDPFFGNDPFQDDFFSQRRRGPSKPFIVQTEAIDVNVLPVPNKFSGSAWLPAEQLIIKDSWTRQPPELKVGEPVTRTITLQAKGLAGSQIPDIEIQKPSGIKMYPETPSSETRTDGNTVFGIQRLKLSYIPNKSGDTTIPAIKIDWWDVKNKKQKTATLPAWDLTVAKGDFVEEELSSASDINQLSKSDTTEEPKDSLLDEPVNKADNSYNWVTLLWLIAALLLGAIIFWLSRKVFNKTGTADKKLDSELIRSKLIIACEKNDKNKASKYLLEYVRAIWNDESIQNLSSLGTELKSGKDVILALEKSLYHAGENSWDGKALLKLLEPGLLSKQVLNSRQSEDDLKPLYPI